MIRHGKCPNLTVVYGLNDCKQSKIQFLFSLAFPLINCGKWVSFQITINTEPMF
jgi:hypothetical protein